jgi:hypothetical protein
MDPRLYNKMQFALAKATAPDSTPTAAKAFDDEFETPDETNADPPVPLLANPI